MEDTEPDEERLNEVIEKAQLTNFLKKLPNGLDTKVGERGLSLSGGERQRIALARAIYKKTDILFLDEFTSNLDLETEEKIMSKIKNN